MKPTLSLLVDSHHGIYSAQYLAQCYGYGLQIDQEDKDILLVGPDHEEYLDVWSSLDDVIIIDPDGNRYFIWFNDGDIWAVPEEWEWDEDTETYIHNKIN